MNFQVLQLSFRLSKMGVIGAAAAAGTLGAYGIYAAVKHYRGKHVVPQTTKESSDEGRSPETQSDTAGLDEVVTSVRDDHRHTADAVGSTTVPPSNDHAGLTEEQRFFNQIWGVTRRIVADPVWFGSVKLMHTAKFATSEPRGVVLNGAPVIIFPITPGLNVTFHADGTVYYLDNGKRQHVPLILSEQQGAIHGVTPANQAKSYVYQKANELLKVTECIIHPSLAYPENFETRQGLATNFELRTKVSVKGIEFFDKAFEVGEKRAVYPYTRSDMAYITTVVNSGPDSEPIRFSNLEGDKFIHIQDLNAPPYNLVLVRRAAGYIQLFTADQTTDSEYSMTPGFEHWVNVKHELFDLSNDAHLVIAASINPAVLTEVMGVTSINPNQATGT